MGRSSAKALDYRGFPLVFRRISQLPAGLAGYGWTGSADAMRKVAEVPKNWVCGLEQAPAPTNNSAEQSADQSADQSAKDSHASPKCLQRRECGYACCLCTQYALTQTQTKGAMADGETLFVF